MADINLEQQNEQRFIQSVADAVLGLEGVSRLSGGITQSITNTVLGRESFIPGIWYDRTDNDEYTLGIYIRVYYGYNIPSLSYDIQSKVKSILDESDVTVKTINISVEGIDRERK